jgi:hypothetical protein
VIKIKEKKKWQSSTVIQLLFHRITVLHWFLTTHGLINKIIQMFETGTIHLQVQSFQGLSHRTCGLWVADKKPLRMPRLLKMLRRLPEELLVVEVGVKRCLRFHLDSHLQRHVTVDLDTSTIKSTLPLDLNSVIRQVIVLGMNCVISTTETVASAKLEDCIKG